MAVLSLTQQGKVEAAPLHIIIAQENQAAVFVELARKRGNGFQGCTQCVFLTKATLEVDMAGSRATAPLHAGSPQQGQEQVLVLAGGQTPPSQGGEPRGHAGERCLATEDTFTSQGGQPVLPACLLHAYAETAGKLSRLPCPGQ